MTIFGTFAGRLAAAVLVLAGAGCTPSPELDARRQAEPESIAAAVCREVRAGETSGCDSVVLTDRASEIAYATCLDYNQRDPRTCDRLRHAFEADIRTQLAARQNASAPPPVLFYKRPPPASLRPGEPAPPAEALYKAATSDADTFQAALLIPAVRKKIEIALGKKLSDAQLRALIDSTRAEAVYWYGRMTQSQPARDTARTAPGG